MASPVKPDRLLIASAGSIVLAVVVVAVQLPTVLAAVFGSGMGKDEPQEVLAKLMDEHDTEMSTYQARFNGRSLFFTPPAPRRRPLPVTPQRDEDPPPPPPPPPPTVYTGPSVVAIVGEEVWFRAPRAGESGLRIRVGDQGEGITVLAANAPWSVRLGYERGEYDIELFARTLPGLLDSPRPTERVPGLRDAPSADAARDEDEDIEAEEEPDSEAEPDAESGAEPGSDDDASEKDDASDTEEESSDEAPDESPGQ